MFASMTSLTCQNTIIKRIMELVDKSPNTILSDLSILSRKINSSSRIGAETLRYSSDKDYNCILLSEIFYNELSYCKRAAEFIRFICTRYKEEEDEREGNNDYDYVETLPMTQMDTQSNTLSQQLLIGSRLLNTRLDLFSQIFGPCSESICERFRKSIKTLDTTTPSATHGQMVDDFQELYSIANNAWNIMSLLASFNLFRLARGSIYDWEPIVSNGSIFYKNRRWMEKP